MVVRFARVEYEREVELQVIDDSSHCQKLVNPMSQWVARVFLSLHVECCNGRSDAESSKPPGSLTADEIGKLLLHFNAVLHAPRHGLSTGVAHHRIDDSDADKVMFRLDLRQLLVLGLFQELQDLSMTKLFSPIVTGNEESIVEGDTDFGILDTILGELPEDPLKVALVRCSVRQISSDDKY
jgi:hypothetical protein